MQVVKITSLSIIIEGIIQHEVTEIVKNELKKNRTVALSAVDLRIYIYI